MATNIVQFFAVIFTALALVPGGAHLFSLPNKIDLAQEHYFVVQTIYRGWALFGFVLFPAVALNMALAVMLRHRRACFRLALLAFLCMAATVVIFFAFTYPANQATNNWTTVPADWTVLRTQWEYSHAVNAVITFLALCFVMGSVLCGRDGPHPDGRP